MKQGGNKSDKKKHTEWPTKDKALFMGEGMVKKGLGL